MEQSEKTISSPSTESILVSVNGETREATLQEVKTTMRPQFAYHKLQLSMRIHPPEWMSHKWSDFNQVPELESIVEAVTNWDYKDPLVCSLLSHQNGIGKTHLAIVAYKTFLWNQILDEFDDITYPDKDSKEIQTQLSYWTSKPIGNVLFITEADLLRNIQSTYDKAWTITEAEEIQKYTKAEILVIDDCFAGKPSDFQRRILLEIIDKRSERYMKPTIITSNLLLSDIADNIDTRIADRLRGQQLHQIKNHVESWRGRQ